METVDMDTADRFLDYLRTSKPHWGPWERRPSPWIFRGVHNAAWFLEPSAWREETQQKLAGFLSKTEKEVQSIAASFAPHDPRDRVLQAIVQGAVEIRMVEDFLGVLNIIGLPLPWASHGFCTSEMFIEESCRRGYILSGIDGFKVNDVFALAQHHGVPTRLLDWSYNPRAAAFFAAYEANNENPKPDRIAVWAMHLSVVLGRGSRLATLTCARHENSFLHAQHGLFLFDTDAAHYFLQTGRWPRLEERVPDHRSMNLMKKITLPIGEAEGLLDLLEREQVSLVHLMPSHDNITRLLKKTWKYPSIHPGTPVGPPP